MTPRMKYRGSTMMMAKSNTESAAARAWRFWPTTLSTILWMGQPITATTTARKMGMRKGRTSR